MYGTPQYREKSRTFNDWLAAYQHHRPSWTDWYPSDDLLDGYTGGPLVVDIGGNVGDDLELFNKKHPGHASQLVLQDLPDKIADAKCSAEILRIAHDFLHHNQSPAGVRAYTICIASSTITAMATLRGSCNISKTPWSLVIASC